MWLIRSHEDFASRQWQPGDVLQVWDQTILWTEKHYTAEHYTTLQTRTDAVGDAALHDLMKASGKGDMFERIEALATSDELEPAPGVLKLWQQMHDVPSWVDWDQIRRGQDVFFSYGPSSVAGLFANSLIGGFASGKATAVLNKTASFSVHAARRRLLQTMQFVLEIMNSVESLQPGGEGWKSVLRVRLLHCMVRAQILRVFQQQEAIRPGAGRKYFDLERFGMPINICDMQATIDVFCGTLIFSAYPRTGVVPTEQEKADFVALWRLVAYYMGCGDTTPWSSTAHAKASMESHFANDMWPEDDTTEKLVHNTLTAMVNQPPARASYGFVSAQVYYLNGSALSEGALGIKSPSLYYRILVWTQWSLAGMYIRVTRLIPRLRQRRINLLRRVFPQIFLHSKTTGLGYVTDFAYEYEVSLDTQTHPCPRGLGVNHHINLSTERAILAKMAMGGGVLACMASAMVFFLLRGVK